MDFNIHGTYKFKQEGKTIYTGHNLITFYGMVYFLNRMINDEMNPLKYIGLGNGEIPPSKNDIKLGNEIIRTECGKQADIEQDIVRLTASFNAKNVVGVTEIGVIGVSEENGTTSDYLISHDTFEEITGNMLTNPVGTVEVEYTFHFSNSTIRQGWEVLTGKSIYWIYEPSEVIGISEESTGNGYLKVDSKEAVIEKTATYYYDNLLKNLYVHIRNEDLNMNDILIQTR